MYWLLFISRDIFLDTGLFTQIIFPMNSWNNIPLAYICISIFLSGFTFYSFVKFIYIYFITGRKVVINHILVGTSALLYVTGDTAAVLNYMLTGDNGAARVFILIRELSLLLFVISMPFTADRLLVLKNRLLRLNKILFVTAIVFSIVILSLSLYSPELMIGEAGVKINYRTIGIIHGITPLLLLKNIVLAFYIIYVIAAIYYSKIHNRVLYPVTKIYISLIIMAYFILSSLFDILFFSGNSNFINLYLPYMSTGIAILLLLNTFSLIDILVDNAKKFINIEKDLKRILYEDKDTGLHNRNSFINDLQIELSGESDLPLIFIDIDDFQNINESFGEKTGDEILKLFSGRLLELFLSYGRLYRIGGDDFVLALKDTMSDEEAGIIAGRIISSMRNPFNVRGVSHVVTVSIGIIRIPRDGDSINSVLTNAYSAIRNAKETKNTYRVFSREMAEHTTRRIGIVSLLRASISNDQFELFYQPVVDGDGNLVYAESLLRCTNADPAIGGPGEFIPLMEKAGLIKDIDDMVIRKAFHDLEMRINKMFGISINLSSNQLVNPAYSDFLFSFSVQHGIDPSQITLEVVENTLIENFETGRQSILNLKEKGFKIAIDDFGKGYSSLSYLSKLPVDIVKIDMAFVQSIPGDPKNEAVASHIMNLAHSLKLKVVAEGFEKKEQVEFFKNIGCDNFQGYYFSRPLPLDEFLKKYFS